MAKKKRVLVTGASGFLGSALAGLLLKNGYEVTALVRSAAKGKKLAGCRIAVGELPDALPPNLCRGMDAVFHTAAMVSLWGRDREKISRVNVAGTERMLAEAIAAKVRRFIHTSSIAVFGSPGKTVNEKTPTDPGEVRGNYSTTKYMAEKAALRAFQKDGLDTVTLNPSVIVGVNSRAEMPMIETFKLLHRPMPFYSDSRLDLVSLDDVVKGHYAAYKKGRPGERYILSDKSMKLSELLELTDKVRGKKRFRIRVPIWMSYPVALGFELMSGFSGKPPPLSFEMLRFVRRQSKFSHKKAAKELGYKPRRGEQAIMDSIRRAGAS